MSYEKHTWETGEVITAEKLNNIENGIESTDSLNLVNGSAAHSLRGTASAEENDTYSMGAGAVAEGDSTKASGINSHAEGGVTNASGEGSHAEGGGSTASGAQSHAEGGGTTASGVCSHAEGGGTVASGYASHAEGGGTQASGMNSHAEGNSTIANCKLQHVFGEYNIADVNTPSDRGTFVEIVGNGAYNGRSNARTLDWYGNESLQGSLTLGKGTPDETTITAAQLKALIALLNS